MEKIFGLICIFTLVLFTAAAQAQWITVDLTPTGMSNNSQVVGVFEDQQVGTFYDLTGWGNASMWQGSPGSWMSFGHGIMYATNGAVQVGGVVQQGSFSDTWATRWNNGSPITLGIPPGATNSVAMALYGGYSAGYYNIGTGPLRAVLWRGTRAINLHPSGMLSSLADAMGDGIQAGYVCPVSYYECVGAIWRNHSSTMNIFHPPGFQNSNIRGLVGDTGVGWGVKSTGEMHAVVWTISTAMTQDVHPAAYFSSGLNALSLSWAVGAIQQTNFDPPHAAVWDLTTGKLIYDLNQFLPPGQYTGSSAFSIWRSDSGTTYVGGMAISATDGLQHPMLWYIP